MDDKKDKDVKNTEGKKEQSKKPVLLWADLSHLTLDEKREYYRAVLERRARQRFYRFHNIGREYM